MRQRRRPRPLHRTHRPRPGRARAALRLGAGVGFKSRRARRQDGEDMSAGGKLHRLLVMRGGRIVGELTGDARSAERAAALMVPA